MFSSGTGPAPNPGRAIALHLLRNCVLHMSGRMPAAFCVYPTVHIKSERKCICLYIQNVLRAAVVKMCIPYHTHLFIKKVYTLLYIQNHSALPIFPLPAAMCTHMHMHFISKKCTPYHTYQFAGSSQEKKTKRSFEMCIRDRASADNAERQCSCKHQKISTRNMEDHHSYRSACDAYQEH